MQAAERLGLLALFILNELDAERATEARGISFAFGDLARELRGIHRLGIGKIFELAKVVNDREASDGQHDKSALDPKGSFAFLQRVNPFLQRHILKSLQLIFV